MKRSWWVVALCTLASARAAAEESEGTGQLIDERSVVTMALHNNPTVDVAEAERDVSGLSHQAARLGLIPEVQITGRYTRLSNVDEKYRTINNFTFPQVLNQLGVRAIVSVPISQIFLNLAANARALGHVTEARELERNAVRVQVAYEARIAFLRYWRAKLGLATALELRRASEGRVSDQVAQREAGFASPNDVLSFEVALDAAVLGEQSAQKELASAEAALRRFLPDLNAQALRIPELTDSLDDIRPQTPAPAESPRISALLAHADSARDGAKAASYERLPKLSVYAAGDFSGPSPRVFVATSMQFLPTWEAGVRLEWSLSQAIVGSALAERAKVQVRQLLARVEEARRQLAAERTATIDGLEVAHARVKRSGERVVRAQALAEARRNELAAGMALTLNVIVAEADLARARNEHVDAIVERAVAYANLDYLDGRVTPSASLGSPP